MNVIEERARSIFLAAMERALEHWPAFLDAACGGDAQLRARVDQLLQTHQAMGSIHAGAAGAPACTTDEPRSEGPGTIIGLYKLIEQIGEGGMGTVYMAQQTEPVKRLVALKLIKPGMDSRQVIARFEAERQALALMDHPNIAHVFDAGTTASGRPYFVMELVKGVPLTKYCDGHRLTPRERLELFIPVCQAIQHAHQKGIIHRDVKPSNVLVALYDDKPVPKVIDFGVAKAAGPQLTEHTLVTGFGTVVGTLEYMSPEQAEVKQLDIDTRSDIYSLGVLLYELLTGTTPLDRKRLREAAMLEMLRMIREEEPPRPSTRLVDSKDSLPSISAQRHMEPAKLTKLVRGELDWIVMKALEKDRNRRYETANGFAQDLVRYLTDEPVQACPPSALYRFRKFARRNRTALAVTAAALFCFILVGGGTAWVMLDRAARQAREANDLELALDRSELFQRDGKGPEARAALEQADLLARRAPADLTREARLAALKERLAAAARDQEFLARFDDIRLRAQSRVNVEASLFTHKAAFPEIRDALRGYGIEIGTLAPAEAAARIQSRPEAVRRELIAALLECFQHAPQGDSRAPQWLLDTLDAADDDAWRVRVRKAHLDRNVNVMEQLAREADVDRQPPSFLIFVADSLPTQMSATRLGLFRRIQRAYPADLWANHWLAKELSDYGHLAEAIRYYTAALALRPDSAGIYVNRGRALRNVRETDAAIADFRAAIRLQRSYATAHRNLGIALEDKRDLDEAIAAYREAIRVKKDFADAHISLGKALRAKHQLNQAIAAFREAIRIKKDMPEGYNNLGIVLHEEGRLDEAIAAFREAIRFKRDFPDAHFNLGVALRGMGLLDEAIAAYREAIRFKRDFAKAHYNLGAALQDTGKLDQAIAAYREAIRLKKDYAKAHCNLGMALQVKGLLDEAIAAYREAIQLKKDFAEAHNNLGAALQDKGRLDEAIAAYREAIQLKQDYAKAHNNLGAALQVKGRLDEAIAAYREAIQLTKDNAEAHYNLGNALREKGQLDEAIAAYRKAIGLKKDFAEAHCCLGFVLRDQGRFGEALAALQAGHKLGSQRPDRPSAGWIRQVEQLIQLDARLAKVLNGESRPTDASERVQLAFLCQNYKKLYVTAVAWYAEAFAAEPKAADDLKAGHRYNAACAAALAGSGHGQDAGKLKDGERARLRQQALDWLRADLTMYGKLLQSANPQDQTVARQQLAHWQHDNHLIDIRGSAAIAKLPAAERQAWVQLWSDVQTLLRKPTRRGSSESSRHGILASSATEFVQG